jgi:RNA polymerase sigma-70 factor (ECF subfamily)
MNKPHGLARAFMAHWKGEPRGADLRALDARLTELLDTARQAFPTACVAPEAFARYLAERASDEASPEKAIDALRAADLYLACACAAGDPFAIAAFEARYLGEVDEALARMGLRENVRDETKQVLRRRFFVEEAGDPPRPPRIVEYSGRGSLRSWTRAAAVRAALRVMRRPKGHVALDTAALHTLAAPSEDLELAYLKRKYGDDFRSALWDAFVLLAPRERNVIRHYFGDGLSIDQIGVVYDVHRATAARWVGKASTQLVKQTRALLRQRLGVSRSELSSILRLLHSQLEMTMRAVVKEGNALEVPSVVRRQK